MDQRDVVIRTVLGEAAGEGPEGWAAVAHVLRNRAGDSRWPDEVGAVALQPMQFSAWNEGAGGNSLVSSYSPDDESYQQVGQIVDAVFGGQIPDNTGGATHYYSPAGMQKLIDDGDQANALPNWLQEETDRRGGGTTTIGGHIFTGLRNGAAPQTAPLGGAVQGVQQTAQGGFSQEDIAAAMQAVPSGAATPAQSSASTQQAPMIQRQQGPGYQRQTDSLSVAMQAFSNLQQKRKGLLG